MSFEQKVAIITGGAWGIGAETARKLASEGANVLIADKDYEAAKENAQQIENNGGSAQAIQIDLSVSEQIKLMIDTAINEWGHIDFLVQNGYRDDVLNGGSAVTLEEERWDSAMDVLTLEQNMLFHICNLTGVVSSLILLQSMAYWLKPIDWYMKQEKLL